MFNFNCNAIEINNNLTAGKFSGVETPQTVMDKDTMLGVCMAHNEVMLHHFFELYLGYKISAESAEQFEKWTQRQNLTGVYRSPRLFASNYQLWLEKTGKVKPV